MVKKAKTNKQNFWMVANPKAVVDVTDKEACYKALGLKNTATIAEIKEAYSKRVKEAHPDKKGSSDEFIIVYKAYHALIKSYEYTTQDVQDKLNELLYLLPQLSSSEKLKREWSVRGGNAVLCAGLQALEQGNEATKALHKKLMSSKNPVDLLTQNQQKALETIVEQSSAIAASILLDWKQYDSKAKEIYPMNKEMAREHYETLDAIIEAISTGKTDKLDRLGHTRFNYNLARIRDCVVSTLSGGAVGFGLGLMFVSASIVAGATTPAAILITSLMFAGGLALYAAGVKGQEYLEPLAKKTKSILHTTGPLKIKEAVKKDQQHITEAHKKISLEHHRHSGSKKK